MVYSIRRENTDKTNTMLKVESYLALAKAYVLSLRDVRNVGLLVFTVIVLLISWSGVKSIQTNYGLQKQVARLSQENQVQTLANADLALQNRYLDTPQYLEVTARQNLGLGAAGETELLVPQSVALAHTVKQPGVSTVAPAVPKLPLWQRNFEAWMNFFLHRDPGTN
jgi:cell division protein FtsB